jgi:hypothetical protein
MGRGLRTALSLEAAVCRERELALATDGRDARPHTLQSQALDRFGLLLGVSTS